MTGVVYNLKKFFKKPDPLVIPPFKQFNYLNLLTPQQITDLIQFAERKALFEIIATLAEKKVILFSQPTTHYLIQKLLDSKPLNLLTYEIGENGGGEGPLQFPNNDSVLHYTVKGGLKPLALRPCQFDLALAPMATTFHEDYLPFIPQMANILANRGRLALSLLHPALEIFLYNQNPASQVRAQSSIQSTVRVLRENNLYLEELIEGVVDQETRPYFVTPDGGSHYEEFRGLPLVLLLRAVKFVKG